MPTQKEIIQDVPPEWADVARQCGVQHFKFELKLATATERFWLCTSGVKEPRQGGPDNWVVGYVTPEYRTEDGSWEADQPYGPGNTKQLQGFDYLNALYSKLEGLRQRAEENPSWEILAEIDATQQEVQDVCRAVGFRGDFPKLPEGT